MNVNKDVVEGVGIQDLRSETSEPIAVSDEDGCATVLVEGKELASLLRCRADGYADTDLELRHPLPEALLVPLVSESSIEGVVVLPDGSPPPRQMTVVAWPVGRKMLNEGQYSVDRFLIESGSHKTETNALGQFKLLGLQPNASYHLIAGGNGLAVAFSGGVAEIINGGDRNVRLTAYHVFACQLEVTPVSSVGEPAARGKPQLPTVRPQVGLKLAYDEPVSHVRSIATEAVQLAGATPFGDRGWRLQRFLFLAGRPRGSEEIPVTMTIDAPGFETVHHAALARRVDLAVTENAEIYPSAKSGSAAFRWLTHSSDTQLPLEEKLAVEGVLEFRGADHNFDIYVKPTSLPDGQYYVELVPVDTYEVGFRAAAMGKTRPSYELAQPLVVQPSLCSSGTFDLAEACSIDIHLKASPEFRIPDRIQLVIATDELVSFRGSVAYKNVRVMTLHGPPFRIDGVDPGDYMLRMLQPTLETNAKMSVKVVAGQSAQVTFGF